LGVIFRLAANGKKPTDSLYHLSHGQREPVSFWSALSQRRTISYKSKRRTNYLFGLESRQEACRKIHSVRHLQRFIAGNRFKGNRLCRGQSPNRRASPACSLGEGNRSRLRDWPHRVEGGDCRDLLDFVDPPSEG
jgi:hypothetical protein